MADLTSDYLGIKSPNPFWLASAPPANSGPQVLRAFEAGWGGAVWKTLGNPIRNVASRFAALPLGDNAVMGFNNIELITDRPLDANLREIAEVKREFPDHAVVVSLMVESRAQWREIIQKVEDAGADGLELNFGCPHGMCERGMGSAVSDEPKVAEEITGWAVDAASIPVIVKLSPNAGDIREPAMSAQRGGAHGISLINTIKSLMGVDLDRMVPHPRVGDASTNGGYCGPAVKPIALHLVAVLARDDDFTLPISGIGGVTTWRDAAEFMALGAANVQVCTEVMLHGYGVVDGMIDGLSRFLDEKGMASAADLVGAAVPGFKEWGELDLNYATVAEIDADACIGCQLCYVACEDGAHQCIDLPDGVAPDREAAYAWLNPDAERLTAAPDTTAQQEGRVPIVREPDCVGCNLCAIVCPVPGCISMVERDGGEPLTWNDIVAAGDDRLPGGLEAD